MDSSQTSRVVVIVGASSGIGHALATVYATLGNRVAVLARRHEPLHELERQYPTTRAFPCDVTEVNAERVLSEITETLGEMDLFIFASGVGEANLAYDSSLDLPTIAVNVEGFTRFVNRAFQLMRGRRGGQIAAISSIAGLRGQRGGSVYAASKAYQIHFLEGLRQHCVHEKLPIDITILIPGFVDTVMAKGDGLFWVAPVPIAAQQIVHAIAKRKTVAYITRRWSVIAWLLRHLPEFIYKRL
ncbi:MAG: SDR family NAD(P)-dependent oxidoreductase [Thermoguttaceae bacterium]|nr:SDR family NAD(P)-dependent oxidoreductase [Thermoguttaceae bacterium]